ncbi:hypothetical protein ATCV1_z235R [Acanthocystis turfacea chlorella virus 1]|uniref:Uncharacterized protein z235R n=1 Tax=Chlorovirus heliozoae TaxID=322019 RepID=A7K8J5_9PHYC|nr:hypothetical protein ATCV1_z235R [Acanthocystis turfacea chlorella virus 1]ABT16369.1 hypothetical protein ATCV1_z235R [Acanthocystis turfacea chlorella virus 1]
MVLILHLLQALFHAGRLWHGPDPIRKLHTVLSMGLEALEAGAHLGYPVTPVQSRHINPCHDPSVGSHKCGHSLLGHSEHSVN